MVFFSEIFMASVDEITADHTLDASGLTCPLPILRAKKTLASMVSGETVHIISTDSGSARDFPVFAKQRGHAIEQSAEVGGEFHFVMRKA